jgi:hypothetical protein
MVNILTSNQAIRVQVPLPAYLLNLYFLVAFKFYYVIFSFLLSLKNIISGLLGEIGKHDRFKIYSSKRLPVQVR